MKNFILAWLEPEFITTPACLGHFGLTAENYFLVPGIVLLAGGHYGLIRSTVPVLSFFAFDFLFFRVINEEITSSVLLCKPIYQRHFYSNDFKNKPFPFFGISRGHFWEIQIYQRIKTAASLQQFAEKTARFCDNVPGHFTENKCQKIKVNIIP